MADELTRAHPVVDWSAAFWAGALSGLIFLLLLVFALPAIEGGNSWVMIRSLAAVAMGPEILAPPATYNPGALGAALLVHFGLSLAFGFLLALTIHRWGLLVGVLGGAAFGLVLYAINFYTFTAFFPWFFALRSPALVVFHVIFGALAGGIYEALEVEMTVVEQRR